MSSFYPDKTALDAVRTAEQMLKHANRLQTALAIAVDALTFLQPGNAVAHDACERIRATLEDDPMPLNPQAPHAS